MNLVDLTDGKGRLSLEEVQQLRGYVRQGSPVLLAPTAAMRVLDSIERDMWHGYREKMLTEHAASAANAVAEIKRLREDNEQLRGAMKADDERLRVHGERVGLFMDCDTAEHMADEIVALRAEVERLQTFIRHAMAKRIQSGSI